MRYAMALLFATLCNLAEAGDAFTAKDRAFATDRTQRECQSVMYVKMLKDTADSAGTKLAPEFTNASTFPLDKVRAQLKGDPSDNRVVAACDCITAEWRARIAKSTTVEQNRQMYDDIKSEPVEKMTARINRCVKKSG